MTDPRFNRAYARTISSIITSEEYATLPVDDREDICRTLHADLYAELQVRFPVEEPSFEERMRMHRIYTERHDAQKNYEYALLALEEAKIRLDDAEMDYDLNYDDFEPDHD